MRNTTGKSEKFIPKLIVSMVLITLLLQITLLFKSGEQPLLAKTNNPIARAEGYASGLESLSHSGSPFLGAGGSARSDEPAYTVSETEDNLIAISNADDQLEWLLPENFLTDDRTEWLIDRQTGMSVEEMYPSIEQVIAEQYIVMDLDTGEILLEQGKDDKAYPASMTKILTAVTILDNPDYDPEKPVYISEHALDLPSPYSVRSGLVLGEETTTLNALYLMMVASCNDCARALAETYGGTEGDFVYGMNLKAEAIGCTNFSMLDAAGFGLEEHYISPYDLALVIRHAMQNETFRELVKTKTYMAKPASYHPDPGWGTFYNSNKLLQQGDETLISGYLHSYDGVKTGTTDLAGYCLAATVHTYDGRHLVGIIFNGSRRDNGIQDISIMLRAILEEAAKTAGCPDIEDTYTFLTKTPGLIRQIADQSNAKIKDHLLSKEFISDEQAETLFLEPSETEESHTNVIDKIFDSQKTATKSKEPQTEKTNSNNLPETEKSQSSDPGSAFTNNRFLPILIIPIFIILVVAIILLAKEIRR